MGTETFPDAPIVEALVDIQVSQRPDFQIVSLAGFNAPVKDRYSERKESFRVGARVKLRPEQESSAAMGAPIRQGYVFRSPGEGKVVQARMDGFTFSKLKPYSNWEEFREEARLLWSAYFQQATPANVTRVALRYINRIEIPLPAGDLCEYCRLLPDIPPGLPKGLSECFVRMAIPFPDAPATAVIVTMTFEPLIHGGAVLPLILDIDASQIFAVLDPKSDQVWESAERLRSIKNRVFFHSLTERAKNLFR